MKFRTELTPQPIKPSFLYTDSLLFIGSCFAESIGERFQRFGQLCTINPLGIQYNPVSIKKNIAYFSGKKQLAQKDIFYHNNRYRHWDVHSRICHPSELETKNNLSQAVQEGQNKLQNCQWLCITLGSAHVWEHKGEVVSNCHKKDQREFDRRRLEIKECIDELDEIICFATAANPEINILFTVSPVRYLRDGLIENQQSKSTLLLSVHQMCERYPQKVHYFPAYELFIDDLRDYRFVGPDLAHPSSAAVDYIYKKFLQCAVSTQGLNFLKMGEKIHKLKSHIPDLLDHAALQIQNERIIQAESQRAKLFPR